MSGSRYILNEVCDVLETSDGRDKILRSLCYISKLASTLAQDELHAKRLRKFSSQMSRTRTILNLLDDIPMLKHTIDYGFGQKEPDIFTSVMGVLTNVVDHIGYTIEKVTWLYHTKLITLHDHHFWSTINSVCKVISIYLTFMRTWQYIILLRRKSRMEDELTEKYKMYEKLHWITLVRLSLDCTHAINSLPPGCLWSSKLNSRNIGAIGTVSSLLAVFQIFVKRAVKAKYKNDTVLF